MAWWESLREFLYTSILKEPGENNSGDVVENRIGLRRGAVDILFFWLGLFTDFYLVSLAILFFGHGGHVASVMVSVLDAFQEPYLGALGVYVVLKEIRKRRKQLPSQHYGEFFIFFWMLLLGVSSIAVWFFNGYYFDEVYKLIITNSLASAIIYIGGIINLP